MIKNFFRKAEIPENIPKTMQDVVYELKKSKNNEEYLRKAYDILTKKYRGYHIRTYLRIFDLFISDVDKLWAKSGFLHCNHMNYLLRILLVKSGFFNDIRLKWTLVWYISPHQYLKINLGKKEIDIDIRGNAN